MSNVLDFQKLYDNVSEKIEGLFFTELSKIDLSLLMRTINSFVGEYESIYSSDIELFNNDFRRSIMSIFNYYAIREIYNEEV